MDIRRFFFIGFLALWITTGQAQKYVGGDLSMLTRYEEAGSKYYDHGGNAITNMLTFLKDEGWNALRVRLFVDPRNATGTEKGEGVCQDLDYVKALGKRIKEAGFSFLLDFHYSDTWADPSKQWTPSDWLALSETELYAKIYDYTKASLQTLKDHGAAPDLIQIGNEISYGMLWGARDATTYRCYTNSTANWNRFATLLRNAGRACREVCPDARIIIHTERVADTGVLKGFYDNMARRQVDYDIIGISYYPYYHGKLEQLEIALNTLENSFDKDIMVVEAGYPAHWQVPGTTIDYSATYPYSDTGQKAFTDALVAKLNSHGKVKGLFWWWPEANEYGHTGPQVTTNWYNATLFDNNTGRAYSALSSLRGFLVTTGINAIRADGKEENARWYNLAGLEIKVPGMKNVYIHRGKKVMYNYTK